MVKVLHLERYILVPHWAASTKSFRGWDKPLDVLPFEDKTPDLYWRGTTTGPSMDVLNWRQNYRVQFVQYIQALQRMLTTLTNSSTDYEKTGMPLSSLGLSDDIRTRRALANGISANTFNIGFTNAVQCGPNRAGCDNLIHNTGLIPSERGTQEYGHRFLFDLDGNSMSGRFYRLLESNGLVFKQTLLGEWHDDRLLPWIHYVPIGFTSMKDIPLLLDYFINDREGQSIAKEIAIEGRKAIESTFRVEDLSQFWYRLLIEYHRLFV